MQASRTQVIEAKVENPARRPSLPGRLSTVAGHFARAAAFYGLLVVFGVGSLLFGLVGKHRSECAVSDSADVGNLGAVLLVDDQAAPVVGLKADVVQTKTRCVWAATDGNENDVSVHL